MTVLTASALYARAARLTPATVGVTTEDSHCAMCAAVLPMGTPANPVTKKTFDDSFNNKLDLRARSGRYVCGDCEVLWAKDWLQKYSKTYACDRGVFKLASNEHLAGFFLDPPEPPFCAIFSTKQQQHMIWRTPVSLSRDFLFVRVDDEVVTIRRPVLMQGLAAFHHAERTMKTTALARTGRKLQPPAALMSRELATATMGALRTDVIELLRQTGDLWAIQALHALSIGEWWALNAMRHFDPEAPPAPESALEA